MTVQALKVEPQPESDGHGTQWERTLWLMVAVQFVMGSATSVASPMLPLFLPEVGVNEPGQVEFWAGVLSSLNFLVAALVSPLWGSIADRFGRKVSVIRSSMAICLFMGSMAFAQALWQLLALRAAMGAFSGFSAASTALVATQVPESKLGYSLGWLATGQLVGQLIGPVIGGAAADAFGSFRIAFFVTSGLALLAALITLLGVQEQGRPTGGKARKSIFSSFKALAQTGGVASLFVVLLMAQFGTRSVQPIVTLFAEDLLGPVPALATLAGFAVSITGIADLISSPFLGRRSDEIGYRRVLLIGLAGSALATFPQIFIDSYWQFLALRFMLGLFIGAIIPTANALIGRLVPAHNRGLAFGITASAGFMGSFLGPIAGGSVAAVFDIKAVFLVTGTLFVANFIWVFIAVPHLKGSDEDRLKDGNSDNVESEKAGSDKDGVSV